VSKPHESLRILTKRKKVKEAQSELLSILNREFPDRDRRDIAFRPTKLENEEVWTGRGFWYRPGRSQGENRPRLLNWFGVILREPQALRIAVEVNIPVKGMYRRVQGFFARDDLCSLYLMHTGRLGGGADGVGGRAFPEHYGKDRLRSAQYDSGIIRRGFIVTCLSDESPIVQLRQYVQTIENFRDMHRQRVR